MTETPTERAARFMGLVDENEKKTYSKGEVRHFLNEIQKMRLAESSTGVEVQKIKRGDVFMGSMVGGKLRPWVVLHVLEHSVSALAMSGNGESAPQARKSQCRYWPASFLGFTISLFPKNTAMASVTRPYTARAHLTSVERDLVSLMKLPAPKTPQRKQSAPTALRIAS